MPKHSFSPEEEEGIAMEGFSIVDRTITDSAFHLSIMMPVDHPEMFTIDEAIMGPIREKHRNAHLAKLNDAAKVKFDEDLHPRNTTGKWMESSWDEKVKALGVGMSSGNYDRYKIRTIYSKEVGKAKRGMNVEAMVTEILNKREGTDIESKYLPPIPERFTPHEPPTPGEKELMSDGKPITRPREKNPEFQDERDAFRRDLPIYDLHVNGNTTYTFMATPKGIATFNLHDAYGQPTPNTVELHWLIAHDRGAGRAALDLMAKSADKHGVTVIGYAVPLAPVAGKKMSVAKLEKFYEEWGFKTVGRRDSDGYKKIVRKPKRK